MCQVGWSLNTPPLENRVGAKRLADIAKLRLNELSFSVLPRNEWNGIVTIEVTEGGKAAAGATAVQDLAECRPFFGLRSP